jgi:hypothetical protein
LSSIDIDLKEQRFRSDYWLRHHRNGSKENDFIYKLSGQNRTAFSLL